ncbi:RNA polymeras-like protein II Elongator subunit [Ampelomyces quisqualis]|uniref:Elongator complex protein 2 n=1 Tax=Ampelomyces quisqualis TaxID=50730 RepID=A0A6A5QT27_AMPQU|nr:RNA polymeras-like protein II Elongator subunit [Ampelomyces quisqualis]
MNVSPAFIAIGGNRNPAAADWDEDGLQLLAFGADNSVALWDPQDAHLAGVCSILNGHTKPVNAVKFFPTRSAEVSILLSGSADNSLRIWRAHRQQPSTFTCLKTVSGHTGPITRIATLPGSDIFATGASDGTVKIWKLIHDAKYSSVDIHLSQTVTLAPKYFPLNLALAKLDQASIVLAVAGTRSNIQIFVSRDTQFELSATLTGHEGWIRALAFTRETPDEASDLLLASASQDKYIRLWRIHRGGELPATSSALNDPTLGALSKSLSNKAHWIESPSSTYSVTFEALLLGHEDWIYTASWRHRDGKLQLLSTSEDNSVAIWESDTTSGVWVCITRLGEISAQKGSTSATGSAGGLWIGLWSPDSNSIVSLGRTGSWRKWTYSARTDMWTQQVATTGHVREVKGVCWSRDGSYLVTTGSDQTTRLYAQWKRDGYSASWHEFSRPQIHGYDLNCIDVVTDSQFITGADEKLLRVFDEPKAVAEMLQKLCDVKSTATAELLDAANIPVLGLSNKAIQAVGDDEPIENDGDEREAVDSSSVIRKSVLDFSHPPFEDHLARHLLWPETEKLYGHGYEISAVAVSRDGSLAATACRASSIDHAVIRLYDTKDWLEVRPPLKAHSLTVTALQFSPDDKHLLSVGRDRQWVIWERSTEPSQYVLKHSNPKGHTRMILGASWTPLEQPTFMTAGRDKSVKIWQITDTEVLLKGTVAAAAAVTTVACSSRLHQDRILFMLGTESGEIGIGQAAKEALNKAEVTMVKAELGPAKTINQVVWRPGRAENEQQFAMVSDDSSLRLYDVFIENS